MTRERWIRGEYFDPLTDNLYHKLKPGDVYTDYTFAEKEVKVILIKKNTDRLVVVNYDSVLHGKFYPYFSSYSTEIEVIDHIDIANAISKQIAKEPAKFTNDGGDAPFEAMKCPVCGNDDIIELDCGGLVKHDCCSCCGQRINWTEDAE